MTKPTISHEDAQDICDTVWPDRVTAAERARALRDAGWHVQPREADARFGPNGPVIIASVYHPDPADSWSPGDIKYAAEEQT